MHLFLFKIVYFFKWLVFLTQLSLNYKFYFNTVEGATILKEKLKGLGVVGIKLGQYLQSRSDILSLEIRRVLEDLLNLNEAHELHETVNILKKTPQIIDKIESISFTVLGSGSIAQTHICYLKDDPKKYVLKIVHPHIEYLESEVSVIRTIIQLSSKYVSFFVNIEWDNFFSFMLVQKDLRIEAENLKRFRRFYTNYSSIKIPEVKFASENALIMEYCDGIPLSKYQETCSEEELETIGIHVASFFLHTTMGDNCCHGDLHRGNILVNSDKSITVIDFGLCMTGHKDMKNQLLSFYKSMADTDNIELAEDFLHMVSEKDIHNKPVNYRQIAEDWIKFYRIKLNVDNEKMKQVESVDAMSHFLKFLNINGLLIKGQAITFLIQFVLLSTLTENYLIKTLSYMKNNEFFAEELGYTIYHFYNAQATMYRSDIVEKYP